MHLYTKRLPRGPDLFVAHVQAPETVSGLPIEVDLTEVALVLGRFSSDFRLERFKRSKRFQSVRNPLNPEPFEPRTF